MPGRRLRWWPLIVVAGAAAVAVVLASPKGSGDATTGGGRLAPAFELPDLMDPGRTVSLAQFAGSPVVVNFWASWCVHCRKEMPAFQAVSERLEGTVAFVGVNHQDGKSGARDLLDETGVTYASGYDPDGSVARLFALFGLPSTVFISADGRVVGKRTGEMSESDLEDEIERLFGAPVGSGCGRTGKTEGGSTCATG